MVIKQELKYERDCIVNAVHDQVVRILLTLKNGNVYEVYLTPEEARRIAHALVLEAKKAE